MGATFNWTIDEQKRRKGSLVLLVNHGPVVARRTG